MPNLDLEALHHQAMELVDRELQSNNVPGDNLWRSKKSHAASLRDAQRQMWQQGKAPYYWAAFILQGEWRN